ncbi:MAG TPA: hypothetical protein VM802_04405 [Chitinophaga sp.]|uniref:hypothetical protein n=1 Tax=Chitinophaga sp. TaxID=1869181 RepID=UPI002C8C0E57|nr:hypothetical protein [Chitinophaga sp.]HVI44080.1 hypothetical protein [Chitinophaga sp.]
MQRKFCEGFLFFPIRRLRQYGSFIFKQYSSKSGVKTVLNAQPEIFDFNGYYAAELARRIGNTAMPQASKLMQKLETLYAVSRDDMNNSPVLFVEFNEKIISYYRDLNIYQSVVLENLEAEVKPALKKKVEDRVIRQFSPDHHNSLRGLMKSFIKQSNSTASFLQKCINSNNNFSDICADKKMQELIAGIRELALTQQQLVALLQHWEGQQILNGRQVYYN